MKLTQSEQFNKMRQDRPSASETLWVGYEAVWRMGQNRVAVGTHHIHALWNQGVNVMVQ